MEPVVKDGFAVSVLMLGVLMFARKYPEDYMKISHYVCRFITLPLVAFAAWNNSAQVLMFLLGAHLYLSVLDLFAKSVLRRESKAN